MLASPPDIGSAKLEFLYAGSADLVTAKLISGEIAAGVLPVNVAAKLHSAGIPLKVVAVVGYGMVKFLCADPAVSSLGHLKGSTIHIAGQRATPDYLFRYLMAEKGLVAGKDYYPQYNLAYPEVAAQIAAKKITHAVLPEPFATQALLLNPSLNSPIDLDALWEDATGFDTYPMSLLVAMPQLFEKNPHALLAITDAYSLSVNKTKAYPRETGVLAESLDLGMKAAIAQKAIPHSAYGFDKSAGSRSAIDALLGIFISFDPQSVGGRLPSDSFYSLLTP
jgi:NitT/TauT family transport system substrate-binding protein